MSKVQTLRAFVNQRLTLAAEEIFELFERTIAEYEEELSRQHKLLDAVFKPEVRLHRTDFQQLLVSKDEVTPEQQELSPLLDQEEPSELPHIKEAQEELWSSQKGEQLQGLEEADITRVTFIPVPVKSEEDEEKPQSSQLHQTQTEQMKTEADGEDCGGPEPARNFNPDDNLQPAIHEEMSHPTEPETDGSCDWEETREPHTGSNPLQNHEEPDMKCNTVETPVIASECTTNKRRRRKPNGKEEGKHFSCSVCKKTFSRKEGVERHIRTHTGEKPFRCFICGKGYAEKCSLTSHLRVHTGEKPFSCSVCKRSFRLKCTMLRHMGVHQAEKPFSCSVCKKTFPGKREVVRHMRTHTKEKPFSCSVCGKRFKERFHLTSHLRIHTGETPFSCSICKKGFCSRGSVLTHMRIHTGEKPFSCSVCKRTFRCKGEVVRHMRTHTGEKPFSCSICGKRFSQSGNLTSHLRVHR